MADLSRYEQLLYQYLDDVRSGRRIAGHLEKCAVKRFDNDRKREREDDEFPYRLDIEKAIQACQFVELFEHTDGEYAGRPFELYPWQVFVMVNVFGWVHKSTGLRRFREVFLTVGRGNGKSPFGALLMLVVFAFDNPIEHRAEVYATAVKKEQAAIAFGAAKRFVDRNKFLKNKYIKLLKHELLIPSTNSKFEPLSSDAKSADGLNIHGLLRDELHAWNEHQRDYYEKLQTALAKRRQPLAVTITTAGDESSQIWREEHDFSAKVVDPKVNVVSESLFAMIFEIDDNDSEFDEAAWHKANPMLECGVVKINVLRDEAEKARVEPAKLSQFRRYYCNKLTTSKSKIFTSALWSRGAASVPFDQVNTVYAGVDLGWNDDLAAVGYVAPLDWVSVEGKSKRRFAIWVDVWIPAGSKRDLTRPPFKQWIDEKRIVKTDSEWTDTAPIYDAIEATNKQHGIASLAYDPANAQEFALNCVNTLGLNVFPFAQAHAKYNEPLTEFIIALSEGRILHGNDGLLGWSALNVVEEVNSKGHRMPSKRNSMEKIDPFVAVLMAFSETLFAERQRPSVYETRGPIMLGD